MRTQNNIKQGFTLIELSIVLVIIGLLVGGVLVGQDLIRAAGVRATISQIEKYNTAVKTFQDKYGALPGDLNASVASQFGFVARGTLPGQGDGNGVIQGREGAASGNLQDGEPAVFWVDLSQAGLVDGGFSTATMATDTVPLAGSPNLYFPQAKLGQGNSVYVWSGGGTTDGTNYFGISVISGFVSGAELQSVAGLTVSQAYNIDKKIDDGLPQSGNVTAMYPTHSGGSGIGWGSGNQASYSGPPTAASSTTCYDNGNQWWTIQQYSLTQNGGAGVNCALSFRFQ